MGKERWEKHGEKRIRIEMREREKRELEKTGGKGR